jgi:hypothetical protein
MESLEIKFSRVKLSALLLITFVFVAGGIFLIVIAKDTRTTLIGWSSVVFFGFGVVVFLKQFLNTAPRMILDDEGIEDKSLGVGKILWDDIVAAYPNNFFTNKFISLQLTDLEKYLQRTSKRTRKIVSYNKALGFEALNLNLVCLNVSQDGLMTLIKAHLFISARNNGQVLVEEPPK